MQPPSIDVCYDYAVQRYFEHILPCFLTRHYRGGGYGLVAEMLAAHDQGVPGIEAACEGVEPSPRSLKMARRVRSQCPPVLTSGGRARGLFGLFTKEYKAITGEMFQSYRETSTAWRVQIFADTFMALVPMNDQPAAALLTVFHEYIHYFESFLLRSEQTLRSREEGHHGVGERAMTVAEAHARDRRIMRRRRIWRGLALGVVLVVVGLAVLSRFEFETEADRARWRQQLEAFDQQIATLQATIDRQAAVEARARAVLRGQVGLSVERFVPHVQERCPGAATKALRVVQLVTVDLPGDGLACVRALEASAPEAALVGARRNPRGAQLTFRVGERPAQLPSPPATPPQDPDFGSLDGKRLREAIRIRFTRVLQLRPAAQRVASLEALVQQVERPPPPVGDLLAALPAKTLRLVRTDPNLEVTLDAAGTAWARARLPEGDRAHVIGGWILAGVRARAGLSGQRDQVAWFIPVSPGPGSPGSR